MTARSARQAAIRFFADNAGYATPPGRMVCAKQLADAEAEAKRRQWYVEWNDAVECFCAEDDVTCECDRRRQHNATHHWPNLYQTVCVCEEAMLLAVPWGAHGYDCAGAGAPAPVLASLSGICSATPEYRRVVAAELAAEALAERHRKEGAA